MITDLVRNDLSQTAQKRICTGYRTMRYLFFMQVHQMISTVTSKLDWQYSAVEAIKGLILWEVWQVHKNFGYENYWRLGRN
jgi:anthranilate/para-aminobenzoate synthase component I